MSDKGRHHTITALVEDKPGVLARVAGLFRRRGLNIVSLAVGQSEQRGLSRMVFVVDGDQYTVDQATKQLDKLIEVVRVSDITHEEIVSRELALIKVKTTSSTRAEIIEVIQLFRANVVDVGSQTLVVEITGEEDKINAMINLLEPFGILEMMRTGRVSMVRGQAEGRVSDSIGIDFYGNYGNELELSAPGSYEGV